MTSIDQASEREEFLSFRLGTEEYGIDILKVQEIRAYEPATRLPNTPDFIKGVINLRGSIVPVVDLRLKLGLAAATYDGATVVIVLNLAGRTFGVVVDSVSDVLALAPAQIRPAPEFAARVGDTFVRGLAALEERLLIIADIERLLTSAEMALVRPH